MLAIAWCLDRLGHDVRLAHIPTLLYNTSRWQHFNQLVHAPELSHEVLIAPEHGLSERRVERTVCFKTSVSCADDRHLLESCDLVVAHENDPEFNGHTRLLPVPFMVGDPVMQLFCAQRLLDAYLSDDLHRIRDHFGVSAKKMRRAGHIGAMHYGRNEWADLLPSWCEFVRTDSAYESANRVGADEYMRFLASCEVGIFMAGDTPKSYRWAELALLGVPIVCVAQPVPITPPATPGNTIMLDWWDDHAGLERGMSRRREVAAKADTDYRDGWSPMGQAKQIVAKLEQL